MNLLKEAVWNQVWNNTDALVINHVLRLVMIHVRVRGRPQVINHVWSLVSDHVWENIE